MDLNFATLIACFFLSGFAALLYQTAWTRELSFVFGTSEVAVVAVLAAYMGGLAFGSALAARWAPVVRRPAWTYGLLESGIAGCALLMPLGTRALNAAYARLFGGITEWPWEVPAAAGPFQLLAAFALLLAPTALMGATLPLLARHAVRNEAEITSRIGALYAINTVGAIGGTLIAAFWFMPEWGLRKTVWIGAAVNGLVFVLAMIVSRGGASSTSARPSVRLPAASARPAAMRAGAGGGWILPAILLSGCASFTLEVVWTRLLGHLLGASQQAFAVMLASFLAGIAIGSACVSRWARTRRRAIAGFAVAQIGTAVLSGLAFGSADAVAGYAAAMGAGPGAPTASAAIAMLVLLPATLCIGATFPLAIRIATPDSESAARETARVYAWNTLGAILGALGGGYFVLPALGFAGTVVAVVVLCLLLAGWSATRVESSGLRRGIVVAIAVVLLVMLASPPRPPHRLLASTPLSQVDLAGTPLFEAVGRSSTVLVTDQGTHFQLASNGLPEAGIRRKGTLPSTRTAYWLGVLPALLRPENEDLLMIGFGGGVGLEYVPESIRTIDVIELEPRVIEGNRVLSRERAKDPLADPRVRIHLGDARGSLRLNEKRFGAIVSQPSHPWTSGASHLYTEEFFRLVHSRLRPDGVFVQWIGMAFLDEALLRSVLGTLADVYPHVGLYQPEPGGLLFAASPSPIGGTEEVRRFLEAHREEVAEIGFEQVEDLAATWLLDTEGVRRIAAGAVKTTDDHNLLATRSARLGPRALDRERLAALLENQDPLMRTEAAHFSASARAADGPGLDGMTLIREVVRSGGMKRGRRLASLPNGQAERRIAQGEIERIQGALPTARAHFEAALSIAPRHPQALAGWVLATQPEFVSRLERPLLHGAEEDPKLVALVEAWRSASREDWPGIQRLDAALATGDPGSPLFEATTQLRIRWRLQIGDSEQAQEAQTLAARLLRRRWSARDAWSHAQAAALAGDLASSAASIIELERRVGASPTAKIERRVQRLVRRLPATRGAALTERLARLR